MKMFERKGEGKTMVEKSVDGQNLTTAKATVAGPRPMPIIILADISGSMKEDNKIETLNESIREMINSFAEATNTMGEINVAVITFGRNSANIHLPLTPASEITWEDMEASGVTPMGEAFLLAKKMIEDKSLIPSRAYSASIVLVSDGKPTDKAGISTDDWRKPLEDLLSSERVKKGMRFAVSIGADAEEEVLKQFASGTQGKFFMASEVREIRKFFKWVTMTVTTATVKDGIIYSDIDINDVIEY